MGARSPDCFSVPTTEELSQERVTVERISFRSPLKNMNKSACGCGTNIFAFDSAHILFRMSIFVIVCFRLTLFRLTNQTSNQIINNLVLLLYIPYRLCLLFIYVCILFFSENLIPHPSLVLYVSFKHRWRYGRCMARWQSGFDFTYPWTTKSPREITATSLATGRKWGGRGWWLFLGWCKKCVFFWDLFKVGGGVGADGNLKSNKWFNCGMYQNLL